MWLRSRRRACTGRQRNRPSCPNEATHPKGFNLLHFGWGTGHGRCVGGDLGTTGFVVSDVAGTLAAVDAAGALDRAVIRDIAVARFDTATMIDRYVAVYRAILDDQFDTT